MGSKETITCECGGRLSRPIPQQCPHCGAKIVGLRRRYRNLLLPGLAVIAMIAALVLYVWYLAES